MSPVTLTANAARSLRPRRAACRHRSAGALAWIVGLLAVFIPLCVWRYRRMS